MFDWVQAESKVYCSGKACAPVPHSVWTWVCTWTAHSGPMVRRMELYLISHLFERAKLSLQMDFKAFVVKYLPGACLKLSQLHHHWPSVITP